MNNNDNNNFKDRSQIIIEDMIQSDPEAMDAIQLLRERGYTQEQVEEAMKLKSCPKLSLI